MLDESEQLMKMKQSPSINQDRREINESVSSVSDKVQSKWHDNDNEAKEDDTELPEKGVAVRETAQLYSPSMGK